MAAIASFLSNDVIDLTQIDDQEHEEEEEEVLLHIGTLKFDIVGLRYYKGIAHPGEFVSFVREPQNPYDPNAIRVDNMHGEKIGHIKRQQAAKLAPVMDSQEQKIKFDGTIPRPRNQFSMPVEIDVYTRNDSWFEIEELQDFVANLEKVMGKAWFQTSAKFGGSSPSKMLIQTTKLDWKAQQSNLDEMFEAQCKKQLENLPAIKIPRLLTALFDYQLDGVRWLVAQEKKIHNELYREVTEGNGKEAWLCEITMCSQIEPPKRIKGGILADAMGLGKSIQTIGLILSNPPKGITYPVNRKAILSSPCCTLIVCPVSVMSNWTLQIDSHVAPNTLHVALYHGADRRTILEELERNQIDVLVVSYHTLLSEYTSVAAMANPGKPVKKKVKGRCIFDQVFHRIVLDEAHTIRSINKRFFKATFSLKAEHKLCLTGTPFVNRVDDIRALMSFLEVQPFDDECIFRRAITTPIQNNDLEGLKRLRAAMAHIALRRTKETANIRLAGFELNLCKVEFLPGPHKDIHDVLFSTAQTAFRAALRGGTSNVFTSYHSIIETLLRVRQACCHGALVPKSRRQRAEEVLRELNSLEKRELSALEGKKLLEKLQGVFTEDESLAPECSICFEEMNKSDAIILRTCEHVFCRQCTARITSGYQSNCPLCRRPFTEADTVQESIAVQALANPEEFKTAPLDDSDMGVSPKILAMLETIKMMEISEKAVIFSQFTGMLDIVERELTLNGYTFTRIDGSKTATQRINAMSEFNKLDVVSSPRFILCSLLAAGTGINLTRGNVVFMLDSWWNRSVEQQAMDRVHRIGQVRNVRVYRFVMKNSIEERIVALQESKAALAKGSMEKLDPEESRKARVTTLRTLFQIEVEQETRQVELP